MIDLFWYAYVHSETGELHLKRHLDQGDYNEAKMSPFVARITSTFKAEDRDDALTKARKILRGVP